MATKLIDKGNAIYQVTTEVNGKAWKDAQDKATKKLCENVEIKGFRKGKAPLEMAKQRLSNGQIYEEAMNIVLPDMFSDVVKEHNLKPFYRPDVKPTKVSNDLLEVEFTVICYPEVTLGNYKDIKIPLGTFDVKKDEIDAAIDHLKNDNAEWVMKDGAAEKGDTVVLDFKGYVDGKEFEGGSAENYSLVLGSNQFIPGFEEQLIGSKTDEKIDVNVTFPEQYVKELAGKKAKFACKIHEIKNKKFPEINDEFAKSLNYPGVTTVVELNKYEKDQLMRQKESQARDEQFNKLIEKITEGSKVVVAPQVIESEAKSMKEDMIKQISQNGLTYEQYKEITGMDDEKIDAQYKVNAEKRLSSYLVLNKIGEVEHLVVTEDDINDYYGQMAKQYNMKIEDIKKYLEPQRNQLASQLEQGKIEKFLIANNLEVAVKKPETVKKEKVEKKPTTKKVAKKETK
ncbi:MAG: trigger factor [Bacilli bacterium]